MTENNPDDKTGPTSPWSAQAAQSAQTPSGDRTPGGEQGPARVAADTPAREEQGLAAPGVGTNKPVDADQPVSTDQPVGTDPTVGADRAVGTNQTWVGSPWQQQGGWQQHPTQQPGQHPAQSHPAQHSAQPHPAQPHPTQQHPTQQHPTQQGAVPPGTQHAGNPQAGTPHAGLPLPGVPHQYPQPRREPRRTGLVVGVAVLALVVGGGAGAAGGWLAADGKADSVSTALDTQPTAKQTGSAPAGSVESVAQKVLPTVVQLQVRGRSSAGEGSGFVISRDGYIVTNNHVIEGAVDGGQIQAVFQDGRTATATVVGRDPNSDVAVVKAAGVDNLAVSELGRSDDLRVGQAVVAIGSPFELSGTVTSGIVSSLQRPTRAGGEGGNQATVMDAVQTDAAINPGNSGGPLVNMQGQVIGINSAIYSPQSSASGSGGSVGIGFAIPIDQARRTADEIVKTGKATQTVLGVSVRDADAGGALIADVTGGGAGAQAGLKSGDVVSKLDDRRIDTADALVAAVRSHAPSDKVTLTLSDGRTVQATLGGQTVETR
ncbi:trypsin-like peptidase domain-containing protein [Actinokineospora diospyrosa]|uniref:Serine protease PepD n=1 Tax=Actinokineospora diospyrosa TaxID=103728 RepID=A0ABT1IGF3_9PSEU|nr:trypsin-like peptidase domain-containing protein [Actinokineospora diospyrosa]MCP2271721.1 putative serine protease PepD [Actinokineospora diospyrosa]